MTEALTKKTQAHKKNTHKKNQSLLCVELFSFHNSFFFPLSLCYDRIQNRSKVLSSNKQGNNDILNHMFGCILRNNLQHAWRRWHSDCTSTCQGQLPGQHHSNLKKHDRADKSRRLQAQMCKYCKQSACCSVNCSVENYDEKKNEAVLMPETQSMHNDTAFKKVPTVLLYC